MHRVVLFSEPVLREGDLVFGKLYAGGDGKEITDTAKSDYLRLLIMEKWDNDEGCKFREKEHWILKEDEYQDWWEYDPCKYTFVKGYEGIPDKFVELCNWDTQQVAVISGWVPLRFADCSDDDYIINRSFHDSIMGSYDSRWEYVVEPVCDDLPF